MIGAEARKLFSFCARPDECILLHAGTLQVERLLAVTTDDYLIKTLEKRLGRLHARQRLGIETGHEAQVFGQGLNFFHIENLRSSHFLIRMLLVMIGLYRRGLSNAKDVQLRHNHIWSSALPCAFDGFTMLQLSDLHAGNR